MSREKWIYVVVDAAKEDLRLGTNTDQTDGILWASRRIEELEDRIKGWDIGMDEYDPSAASGERYYSAEEVIGKFKRRIEKLEKVSEAADTHQCTYKRKVALQASLPRTKLVGQRPPPEPCIICQALRDAEEE